MWWFFAMIPFIYVVAELAVGLSEASSKQAASVSSLTAYARWLTIISWLTYPCVYIIKMLGISGVTATAGEQIGYSVADVVAKAVFGVLIWAIAAEKSKIEEQGLEGELLASEAKVNRIRDQLEKPSLRRRARLKNRASRANFLPRKRKSTEFVTSWRNHCLLDHGSDGLLRETASVMARQKQLSSFQQCMDFLSQLQSDFPLVVVQTERSRNIASEQCMRRSRR